MKDDRELVFARIRAALSTQTTRAAMPEYADEIAVAERALASRPLLSAFAERLTRVRGVLLWNVWDQVDHARTLINETAPFETIDLKSR